MGRLPRGEPMVPVAMLAVVVAWGSAFSGSTLLLEEVDAFTLTCMRALVTALALTAVRALRRPPPAVPVAGDRTRLLLAGLTGVVGYNLALFAGTRQVGPGTASVVVATTPLFVALLALWLFREPLRGRRLTGLVTAFAGVLVVSLAAPGGLGRARLGAVAILLAAPLAWTLYTTVARPLAGRYDALRLNERAAWFATGVSAPLLLTDLGSLARLPATHWLWLLHLGVVLGAVSVVVYAWALRHWTAAGLSSFMFLVPVSTAIWAWMLLDEMPGPGMLVGGVLVVGGLVLVWRSRPITGWLVGLERQVTGRRARRSRRIAARAFPGSDVDVLGTGQHRDRARGAAASANRSRGHRPRGRVGVRSGAGARHGTRAGVLGGRRVDRGPWSGRHDDSD